MKKTTIASSWKDSWNANMNNANSVPSSRGRAEIGTPQHGTQYAFSNVPAQNPWIACFKKYATFSGRARRKEYWSFLLINNLVCGIIMFIAGMSAANLSRTGHYHQKDVEAYLALGIVACLVYGLIVALPTLAVTVRRLHDTGRSGWFILINAIPVIGPIVFFVTMLLDSQPGVNRYGPNPKMADENPVRWQIR